MTKSLQQIINAISKTIKLLDDNQIQGDTLETLRAIKFDLMKLRDASLKDSKQND